LSKAKTQSHEFLSLELAVLGTILEFPESLPLATQHLHQNWEEHWTDPRTKVIAEKIISLEKNSIKPDYKSIERALKKSNLTAAVKFLPSVINEAETTAVLESRSKELQQITKIRMMRTCLDKGIRALDGSEEFNHIYSNFKNKFAQIFPSNIIANTTSDITDGLRKQYFDKKKNPDILTGIPTGFTETDKRMLGLQYGKQTILGARPSHGKSAIAGQIALTAAYNGFPVLIFSHEMSKEQFVRRMACNVAAVNLSGIQMGSFNINTEKRLFDAFEEISKLPIWVVEQNSWPEVYIAYMKYMRQRWGKRGLVIVDYIQLERLENSQTTRNEELARINWMWVQALKETDNASLFLAQISRKGAGKEPDLQDLKESGSLEQDADAVLLWWRPGKDDKTKPANQGILNLAKNKDGKIGRQQLLFTGYCQRFEEWREHTHTEMTNEEMENSERKITIKQHYSHKEKPDA